MPGPAPQNSDEREAQRRFAKGDQEALAFLLTQHRAIAHRTARSFVGSACDAEDVFQQAAERAWQYHGTYDPRRAFWPWFLRIVVNCARDWIKQANRERAAPDSWGPPQGESIDPEAAAEAAIENAALWSALTELSEDYSLVLICRVWQEMSVKETAEYLGWPEGTVKSRMHGALAEFRKVLTKHDLP